MGVEPTTISIVAGKYQTHCVTSSPSDTELTNHTISHDNCLTTSFQVDLGKPVPECLHSGLYQAEDNVGVCDNGAIRQAKLQSVTTNKLMYPAFYRPDALHVTQPTVSEH